MPLGHFGGVAARPPSQGIGGAPAGQDLAEQSRRDVFEGPEGAYEVKMNVTGRFSWTAAAGTGTQAITGVGFKPKGAIFYAIQGDSDGRVSIGVDDGVTPVSVCGNGSSTGRWTENTSFSISIISTAGIDEYRAKVQSFDADGFTITRTEVGDVLGSSIIVDYEVWR